MTNDGAARIRCGCKKGNFDKNIAHYDQMKTETEQIISFCEQIFSKEGRYKTYKDMRCGGSLEIVSLQNVCPNVTDLNCLIFYEFFQKRKMPYKWRKHKNNIKNLQI